MSEINEQAARLVCGWQAADYPCGKYWDDTDGNPGMQVSDFKPSARISQCFEFIIPAMRAKGWEFELFIGRDRVQASFAPVTGFDGEDYEYGDPITCELPDPTKAAECITTAAIKAARAMEGRDE